jgi:LPS export ABC transporter protein LptC
MRYFKVNIFTRIAFFAILIIVVISCENKADLVKKSDLLSLPSVTVRNDTTVFTDSGKLQLILYFPVMEQFDNDKDNTYSEFKSGIHVIFYDGKTEPEGSVLSKYAKYTQKDNTWELRDSVVVLNEKSQDKLETEVLFWDQKKDLIYTDRFVKITNPDQITQAFGFESDSHLRNRKLKKVTAIIYLKEEQ